MTKTILALAVALFPLSAFAQTWCGDDPFGYHVAKTPDGFAILHEKSGLNEYIIPEGKEGTWLPYVANGQTGDTERTDFILSNDGKTLTILKAEYKATLHKCLRPGVI